MANLTYIETDFRTFSEQNTIAEVMAYFEQSGVSHIYIVDEDQVFVGTLAFKDLLDVENQRQTLDNVRYLFERFYAEEHKNKIDLLSLFITHQTTVLPVVKRHKIIGSIQLSSILQNVQNIPVFDTSTTSFLISKEEKDYTMSEVVQIVESYNGKVFGVFLMKISEGVVTLLVKCKVKNINELLQSFRRYDYEILSKHQEDIYIEDVIENSHYLEKYLSL